MTMSIRERQNIRLHEAEYQKEVQQKEDERMAPIVAAAQRINALELQIAEEQRLAVQQTVFTKPHEFFTTLAQYTRHDQSIAEIREAFGAAITALKKYLLDEFGLEPNEGALEKLKRVSSLNFKEFDVTSLENWKKVAQFLDDNRCFGASDFKVVRTVKPVAETTPEPEPTLADIHAAIEAAPSTREGDKAARRLAVQGIVAAAQPVYQEFAEYLIQTFDRYLTKAEGDQCIDWMRRANLRLDDIANWHRARKRVLQLLTPEEVYSQQMDIDADTLTGPEFCKKYKLQARGY